MKERRRKRARRQASVEKIENPRGASGLIHIHPHQILTRIRPGQIFTRIRLRHILAVIAAILISLTAIGLFKLHKVYARYAAIVDKQLVQHSLQRHGGVYAAPRRVSVEQRISRNELRERLLRAGYQERQGQGETQADRFSSGSFVFEGDTVKLLTNEFARAGGAPQAVNIKFGKQRGERIISIEDAATGQDLKSVTLPPELIASDGASMQPEGQARFDDFPPALVKALIAIEDRSFFSHRGIDVKAVCRATWENWRHGQIREGGSTITQQLVKTSFLTPERTFRRKFTEALMAVALERRLSKEEIFTIYANHVYLGQSGLTAVYGFKQAARLFFGKDPRELSLAESALIAGLARAPNRYSPYLHPDVAATRRNTVLDAMVEMGDISSEEAEAAKSEKLAIIPPAKPDESAAQYFVDYLKRELASRNISEKVQPNLKIQTTLDLDLQQAANIAVRDHLEKLDRVFSRSAPGNSPEAALIAIDPRTGEILAMVGGRDYASSQLNRVTDARRQPGSVFKPIVYAAALTQGISPEAIFDDAPREFVFGHEIYRPENYGGRFSNRRVTLREGIVRSLNVVAVDAAMRVGLPRVADIAQKMGLPRPDPYPSMALGAFEATPYEIAQAYSTFASGGMRVFPFGIRSVASGDAISSENTATKIRVLGSSTAYLITETLADVVNRGTATRVRGLGYRGPAAGKTGSSRDAWFAGYTPNLLVVVWVGFDDHRDLGLTGGEAAVPIWADFVNRALALRPDLKAEKFQPDQARPTWRKGYSMLAGNPRRRSARRINPASGSDSTGGLSPQPMSDGDELAPELQPVIIRKHVGPARPAGSPTPPATTSQKPETKPETKKEEPPRPNHQ